MIFKTLVKVVDIILTIFPGFYFCLIVLGPPFIIGAVFHSITILIAAIITHMVFILTIPPYIHFWRTLTYIARLLYTILLLRYFLHVMLFHGMNISYADISDVHSVEDFYKDKKRSIRRRMTKQIPEGIAKVGVKVNYISSNSINMEHLTVQYVHSRKYSSQILPIYRAVFVLFALVGNMTEYRIEGKLVGQCISFWRGDSYTIFQYGCTDEASRIGLWFYNVYEHIRQAISVKAQLVNGTIEIHKPEAKSNAGFVSTNDQELVIRLYGKLFDIPKRYCRLIELDPL